MMLPAFIRRTSLVLIYSLFPAFARRQQSDKKIPLFLPDQAYVADQEDTTGLFIHNVHLLAAPFILFRLKRTGYSNCRVTVKDRGLLVTATR